MLFQVLNLSVLALQLFAEQVLIRFYLVMKVENLLVEQPQYLDVRLRAIIALWVICFSRGWANVRSEAKLRVNGMGAMARLG